MFIFYFFYFTIVSLCYMDALTSSDKSLVSFSFKASGTVLRKYDSLAVVLSFPKAIVCQPFIFSVKLNNHFLLVFFQSFSLLGCCECNYGECSWYWRFFAGKPSGSLLLPSFNSPFDIWAMTLWTYWDRKLIFFLFRSERLHLQVPQLSEKNWWLVHLQLLRRCSQPLRCLHLD